jgi:hypothetical protein
MWLGLAVVAGCSDAGPDSMITSTFSNVEQHAAEAADQAGIEWRWSEPVNLGAVVNSDGPDTNPSVSPDELSLYFVSQRAGGQGGSDIWVSQRASVRDPWGAPVNLGPIINSASLDAAATISDDGHLLFFHSDRPGGHGDHDLYVSYRANVTDDFAWEQPTNLGSTVNTAFQEAGAEFVNASLLIFNRRQALGGTPPYDVFTLAIGPDGMPTAAPQPIAEINTSFSDFGVEVNDQEREMLFVSTRPGGLGGNDIWRATRLTKHDTWRTPENVTPLNTALNDRHPTLLDHGRTLIFSSSRPGGVGSDDLWMSTRRPGGQSAGAREP